MQGYAGQAAVGGSYVASERGSPASLAKSLYIGLGKHIAARHGKRLDVVARKLGHHLVVSGILTTLGTIPCYLLKRAPHVPQAALVIVERLPQRKRVGHVDAVAINLVPRHKHRRITATARAGIEPQRVKIAAHPIGGALKHNECAGH